MERPMDFYILWIADTLAPFYYHFGGHRAPNYFPRHISWVPCSPQEDKDWQVNILLWVFWTSLWSISWKLYSFLLGDVKKNGHSSIHLLIFITYSNPPQSLCWSSPFTKPWRICTGSRLHPPRAPRLHRRRGAAPAGRPGGGRCNNGLLELRWASPCRGTRGGAASAAWGEGGAVRGEDGDLW